MDNCLFCRIVSGEIPSTKVYEDDQVLAFRDIAPQAPVHVLVIPKKHIKNWLEAENEADELLAHMMRTVSAVAKLENVQESGFRVVSNSGADACQSVSHLHMHVLAGTKLSEQMA